MMSHPSQIIFGPVPSRRLGRSLGINNIPYKHCTYSCIYCQLGRTANRRADRCRYHRPEELLRHVEEKLENLTKAGEAVDYLTFVSDGEPSLDTHLKQEIELLKTLGVRVAVITNASLIARHDVFDALLSADWVSLKIDTVNEAIWRIVNRPAKGLNFNSMMAGIFRFSETFTGELSTETMLIRDINDHDENVKPVADSLVQLKKVKTYLSVPSRPPAEKWVRPPDEDALLRALQVFRGRKLDVEVLRSDHTGHFSSTGDPESDLLSITAVHPMSEQEVDRLLARTGADRSIIENLIERDQLQFKQHGSTGFYSRTFKGKEL